MTAFINYVVPWECCQRYPAAKPVNPWCPVHELYCCLDCATSAAAITTTTTAAVVSAAGLSIKVQATLIELLEAQGLPSVCVTMALQDDAHRKLGDLLAAAVKV